MFLLPAVSQVHQGAWRGLGQLQALHARIQVQGSNREEAPLSLQTRCCQAATLRPRTAALSCMQTARRKPRGAHLMQHLIPAFCACLAVALFKCADLVSALPCRSICPVGGEQGGVKWSRVADGCRACGGHKQSGCGSVAPLAFHCVYKPLLGQLAAQPEGALSLPRVCPEHLSRPSAHTQCPSNAWLAGLAGRVDCRLAGGELQAG